MKENTFSIDNTTDSNCSNVAEIKSETKNPTGQKMEFKDSSSSVPDQKVEVKGSTSSVPDGGYGWMIVLSAFLVNMISDGFAFSFGVVYSELLDIFQESKAVTSWVPALFYSVPLIIGPITSALTLHHGCRKVAMVGGLLSGVGVLASAFANSIEVLCITLGCITGFGMSAGYVTSSLMVTYYFEKRRALATGLAVCGSGVGTFVFSPVIRLMILEYGWRGSFIILSGITFNLVVCGALLRPIEYTENQMEERRRTVYLTMSTVIKRKAVKPNGNVNSYKRHGIFKRAKSLQEPSAKIFSVARHASSVKYPQFRNRSTIVPPWYFEKSKVFSFRRLRFGKFSWQRWFKRFIRRRKKYIKMTLDPFVMFNPLFLSFVISNFLLFMCSDIPYVFMVDRSVEQGIPEQQASFIVSVIGIVNTIGQLFYGYIGDRDLNLTLLYGISIATSGLIVMIVPFFTSYIAVCILAAGYGLFISANYALDTVILVEFLGIDKLASSYGLTLFVQGIANLIGPPVAGVLRDVSVIFLLTGVLRDVSGNYDNTFYFGGGFIILSGGIIVGVSIIQHFTARCKTVNSDQEPVVEDT